MSTPAQYSGQSGNDSDGTYCSEVELQPQKRKRRQTIFFQSKSRAVEKLEQMVIQRTKPSNFNKKEKVLKTLKLHEAKNKANDDAMQILTQKMEDFGVDHTHTPKYTIHSKNNALNYNVQNFNNPCTTSSTTSKKFESTYPDFVQSEHAKVETQEILESTNNFSTQMEHSEAINTKDILNCVNYGPSEELKAILEDTQVRFDASQELFPSTSTNVYHLIRDTHMEETSKDENFQGTNFNPAEELKQKFEDPKASSDASLALDPSIDAYQMIRDGNHMEQVSRDVNLQGPNNDNTALSNSYGAKLNVSNNTFETFVKEYHSQESPIIVHSDIKINKPQQQLMDKYLSLPCTSTQTHTLKDFKCGESQIADIESENANKQKSCINKCKRRKGTKWSKKTSKTQESTQSTITNYFSQNIDKNEDQIMSQQELVIEKLSPSDEKKGKIPTLQEAVEMMEVCKRNFKLRLQARKEEMLKLRTMKASCKKEEISCSYNSIDSNLYGDTSNVITPEELLPNMQFLQEIEAQYRKKYKDMGFDLFGD